MLTIGITGGIGSGKSYLCKRLEVAGVPVFYTDSESKKILTDNAEVKAALMELLGKDAYEPDGSIDKKYIAEKIFSSTKLRNAMNAIVHPAVRARFRQWLQELGDDVPLAAMEAAILYESEFDKEVDKVVVITAPPKTRTDRIMNRDLCDEEEVKRRMKAQWPEKRKVELADYVLNNGPQDDLNKQVFELLKKLFSLAERIKNKE